MRSSVFEGWAIAAIVAAAPLASHARAQATHRLVAATGLRAPGTAEGMLFEQTFSVPTLNNHGQTIFRASVRVPGSGVNARPGIWTEGGGSTDLLILSGEQVPGLPLGTTLHALGVPDMNDSGQGAFISGVSDGASNGGNNTAVWSQRSGMLSMVVREGDLAPGFGQEVRFGDFSEVNLPQYPWPPVSSSGSTIFATRLRGVGFTTNTDDSIWTDHGGSLTMIVREGVQAPDAAPGQNFFDFSPLSVGSDGGTFALTAVLRGPGLNQGGETGIWRGDTSGIRRVVMTGDPVPGFGPGAKFYSVDFSSLDVHDRLTFVGLVDGLEDPLAIDRCLWRDEQGTRTLLLREGQAAPGLPGVKLDDVFTPHIDRSGNVIVLGTLTGPTIATAVNDSALFVERDGSFVLLAQLDGAVPGLEAGVKFAFFNRYACNSRGQAAFVTGLRGPGISSLNNSALWVADTDGDLVLIARKGSEIDINDDPDITELRTIASIEMVDGYDTMDGFGVHSGFNELGQVAYRVLFTGGAGSAIFVASIPAPSSVAIVAMSAALFARMRRR